LSAGHSAQPEDGIIAQGQAHAAAADHSSFCSSMSATDQADDGVLGKC
jgi:hypothetical protein